MRTSTLFSTTLLLALAPQCHAEHNNKPQAGYVPDSITAIKIAEAVLIPVYGEKIESEQPFKATLKEDVWIVEGTLNCPDDKNAAAPEKKSLHLCLGGLALVEISKSDAHILRMTHGK
jgi:hypothetical protein